MKNFGTYVLFLTALGLASPALAQQAPTVAPPATVTRQAPAVAQPTPTPGGRAARPPMPAPIHADSPDEPTAPQAFSVVLVLGDMQTTTAQDNVPAAARKALADMKDFLPYKNYRLLDTQWTLCCGREAMSSRLKGADDQEYQLQLSASMVGAGRVNVRFFLGEASESLVAQTAPAAASSPEARARIAELEQQIAKLRLQYDANTERGISEKHPDQAKIMSQIAALQKEAQAGSRSGGNYKLMPMRDFTRTRAIIDTSFRMDVGETVVVGTSRTKGDKALIALLTAVPPKTATTGRD